MCAWLLCDDLSFSVLFIFSDESSESKGREESARQLHNRNACCTLSAFRASELQAQSMLSVGIR